MNHRRTLIGAIGALAFPAPFGALGQSAPAAPRVVLLISSSMRTQSERVDAFIAAGGLIVNGVNNLWMFANAATFVDRILKGRKPAELPFEQPTRVEMVVNMKTAKALGLKFPQSVLVRADRVIE